MNQRQEIGPERSTGSPRATSRLLISDHAPTSENSLLIPDLLSLLSLISVLKMFVKPSEEPLRDIALMFLLRETVPFIGIDDELRFDAEGFERVPELE